MNDIVMARTSLFRPPASRPASQPASQPARIRQSNNQFFPSENLCWNRILKAFANSLDPDETPQNVASHQDPNYRSIGVQLFNVKDKQEHRLAGADRSSIFFLKVKGLSFSITKEGGVE
ncbi:hypothetical protein DPMN_063187 [Dreissena polymorpha]|uniref:Uncharacterized protein n=1 Tax=Dreissena polymorpha TaxID=45954 RepID=A0A9D4HID7_DREPO|nr:hypothetical protein DPMN_063187 [Dreissena polymorpha]